MAETASILCPDKKVLIPDLEAGCSLADMITVPALRKWKAEHPGAVVVGVRQHLGRRQSRKRLLLYVVDNAVCWWSRSPLTRKIFILDMYLGATVQEKTGRTIHLCLVLWRALSNSGPTRWLQMKKEHPKPKR